MGLFQFHKPDPPDRHAIWCDFQTELKSHVARELRDWELVYVLVDSAASRLRIGGREFLVIQAQQDCHQLESYYLKFYWRGETHPNEFFINARVIGIDQRGFIYVNTEFKAEKSRAGRFFQIEFEDGWMNPIPLNTAQRISEGRLEPFDIQTFDPANILKQENLKKFSEWDSIVPGYDRGGTFEDCWPRNKIIKPFIERIRKTPGFWARSLTVGMACDEVFVYHVKDAIDDADINGIMINFCLVAPVAAMGHATARFGRSSAGCSQLELNTLIDRDNATDPIEVMAIEALAETPYTLMTRAQLNLPLPSGIEPEEYCLCEQPWDKVFHLFVQLTD